MKKNKNPHLKDILSTLDATKPYEWIAIEKGQSIGKSSSIIPEYGGQYIIAEPPLDLSKLALKKIL